MITTIIGIDCAVQPKDVGLALGRYDGRQVQLVDVVQGREVDAKATVCGWLASSTPALIALDAPLGWPKALGEALKGHQAGAHLPPEPDRLFRRETDRTVRRVMHKQSLDVGADRIAPTAHAALTLLECLRDATHKPIPLAWDPVLAPDPGIYALEVYPAATLMAWHMAAPGYKDSNCSRE